MTKVKCLRIGVLLSNLREAELILPRPFMRRDAEEIKKFIDAIYTDDDDIAEEQNKKKEMKNE